MLLDLGSFLVSFGQRWRSLLGSDSFYGRFVIAKVASCIVCGVYQMHEIGISLSCH